MQNMSACGCEVIERLCMCCRTLPEAWAQMPRMQFLQLSNNLLSGPLPAGWGAMNSFPMLQAIQMVTAPAPGRRHCRIACFACPPDRPPAAGGEPAHRDAACVLAGRVSFPVAGQHGPAVQ